VDVKTLISILVIAASVATYLIFYLLGKRWKED